MVLDLTTVSPCLLLIVVMKRTHIIKSTRNNVINPPSFQNLNPLTKFPTETSGHRGFKIDGGFQVPNGKKVVAHGVIYFQSRNGRDACAKKAIIEEESSFELFEKLSLSYHSCALITLTRQHSLAT